MHKISWVIFCVLSAGINIPASLPALLWFSSHQMNLEFILLFRVSGHFMGCGHHLSASDGAWPIANPGVDRSGLYCIVNHPSVTESLKPRICYFVFPPQPSWLAPLHEFRNHPAAVSLDGRSSAFVHQVVSAGLGPRLCLIRPGLPPACHVLSRGPVPTPRANLRSETLQTGYGQGPWGRLLLLLEFHGFIICILRIMWYTIAGEFYVFRILVPVCSYIIHAHQGSFISFVPWDSSNPSSSVFCLRSGVSKALQTWAQR